jgi:hypothetical protein
MSSSKFSIFNFVQEDDDDDDDSDYSAGEETALECYSTPLDDDECTVDEYIIFKEVLQSKPKTTLPPFLAIK